MFSLFNIIRSIVQSLIILMYNSNSSTVAPESVAVELERPPSTASQEYWPLTLDAVRDYDLSYMNSKWMEDMLRDGMRAIIRAGQLSLQSDAKSVWTHLSKYSPPENRGFMFSYGDDRIVSLVQNNMETGHSGTSLGMIMRHIEFIAKNGMPAHREMITQK